MIDRDLLVGLVKEAEALPLRDERALDAFRRRADMLIRKAFGSNSHYLSDLRFIDFYPRVIVAGGMDSSAYINRWRSAQTKVVNLVKTMLEEFDLSNEAVESHQRPSQRALERSNAIFIVHGHSDVMKQSVARTLEKLGLKATILHEMPNKGRTIIEKFEAHSNVRFAVVLLSRDDRCDAEDTGHSVSRPRQNVILELGFFLGKLGRENVLALYDGTDQSAFELPNDYSGVLFVPFDSSGRWQFDLVRELKAAGYNISADAIL